MPQLNSFSESDKVWSKNGWVCCTCLTVNRPAALYCTNCDKQRWGQLGLTLDQVVELQQKVESKDANS